MDKVQHKIKINAPVARVYTTMLEDDGYREWTAPFTEGSYFVGDWSEGSDITFLGPDGTGIIGRIETNRPNEFVSILHLGFIKDGEIDTESDAVKSFAGAHENYTFKEVDGGTEVIVDLDTNDDMKEMSEVIYPKALTVLKEICER